HVSLYRAPSDGSWNRYVLDEADARPIDGVVFVADSSPPAMNANRTSLDSLVRELEARGFDLAKLPVVFQLNKRDLAGTSAFEWHEALDRWNKPFESAIATTGVGVFETLKLACKLILEEIRKSS